LYLCRQAPQELRGVTDLLALGDELGRQPLGFTVSRYAGIIGAWQMGCDEDPSVVRLQVEPGLLDGALVQLDQLTAASPVGLPWPALYSLPAALPERVDFVALHIGPEVLPEQIHEYLAPLAQGGAVRVYLTLDPISRSRHDPDERIFDFVMRVLAAKQAGVREVFFNRLTDAETGLLAEAHRPSELLVVARTLTDLLGGTEFAGWMPMEHDANAMVFERADGSEVIVLWRTAGKFPVKEPLYLGESLTQIDLWGNRQAIPRFGSVSSLTLQRMPVFVTGIDPQISRMRRSFRLAEPVIPSAYRKHEATLEFANGFERGVSGQVRLHVPRGWKVDPTLLKFHLAEGERFTQPLSIQVPYNETVGEKEFRAEFAVDGQAVYRFMAVARTRFEMATAATRASVFQDGPSLVVEQEITCTARRPTSFHAYVQVPGRPMLNHFIPQMQPGDSVTKRYILPYTPSLEEKTALVGVRDDTADRGFANLLLPLGGVHAQSLVRTSSALRATPVR
jgi:hypothetical protein